MKRCTFDKKTKVWSGQKIPPMFNSNQGLGRLILNILSFKPSRVAQISADTGASLTCGEIRARTLKIATYLSKLGLKQGDVVAIVAGNSENIAPIAFACFLLGLPVSPIASYMQENNIRQVFEKIEPKLVMCDASNLKTIQNVLEVLKSDALTSTVAETVEGINSIAKILDTVKANEHLAYTEVDPDSTAVILFSSGTISAPKGVCKSHREEIECTLLNYDVDFTGDFVILQSSISWVSGFYFLIIGTIYHFTRIITAQPFHPKAYADILSTHKVSMMLTPPSMIVSLMQSGMKPLEHMRCCIIGGSFVSKKLIEDFEPFVPNAVVVNAYASTEANIITFNSFKENIESCGQLECNMEARIVDDQGNSLENFKQGEIYIKGLAQFSGYYNEPEKTAAAVENGWFKSDDIGYFDDEGFLYFVDRKKDMMQYEGQKISPSELEIIINGIPGVVTSCVVGVLDPATKNDVIHAFVIAKSSSGLTEEFVESFVDGKVSERQKLRGGVHFVDNFPLGVSGKIIRREMTAKAEKMIKK